MLKVSNITSWQSTADYLKSDDLGFRWLDTVNSQLEHCLLLGVSEY